MKHNVDITNLDLKIVFQLSLTNLTSCRYWYTILPKLISLAERESSCQIEEDISQMSDQSCSSLSQKINSLGSQEVRQRSFVFLPSDPSMRLKKKINCHWCSCKLTCQSLKPDWKFQFPYWNVHERKSCRKNEIMDGWNFLFFSQKLNLCYFLRFDKLFVHSLYLHKYWASNRHKKKNYVPTYSNLFLFTYMFFLLFQVRKLIGDDRWWYFLSCQISTDQG